MTLTILLACSESFGGLDHFPTFTSDDDTGRMDSALGDTGDSQSATDTDPNPDPDPGDTGSDDPDPPEDHCDGLTPAMCWVRTNPMVVSGLVPSMGAPPEGAVDAYFDDFGANTAHLWMTSLPGEVSGWRQHRGNDFRFIAWVMDDGTSASNGQVLGGVGAGAPGLVGYQVGDEPEDLAALQAIEVGVDAVRAVDPDALIIVNFSVGKPEIEAMFDYYATDMAGDILSYDRYSYGYAEYEHMMAVREAGLRHGMPYWRYLRSFETKGATPHWPTESDLRWQVYSGLTYGYTGHHWFVYQIGDEHAVEGGLFGSTGTWNGTTDLYDEIADLNRELVNVGRVITQLTSTDLRFIPAASVYMPDGHADWSPGAGGDPYLKRVEAVGLQSWEFQDLAVGLFEDDEGERYLMVLNGNHEGADWPLWTHDRVTVELSFDFSGAPGNLDTGHLEVLNARTGAVTSRTVSGGVMQIELLAGEAVLMKYATGSPWAGLGG